MCGISGFWGDFDDDDLRRMNAMLAHRGPDDEGYYRDGPVGLAHRRLSIIDTAGGHQPLSNEDGSVWISYNGETYNFRELRRSHLASHSFSTRSDTEVVVHLYEEFGERCVDYMRGMFAFAIWDSRRRRLFIARDRFGIKPVYFTETPDGFAFASEIKALLQLPDVDRKVNLEALDSYLTFRYVPGDQTLFAGIRKLEPGHYLSVENGRTALRQYWDISFERGKDRGERAYATELRDRLSEAIRLRLISEVPLGAYLSGGLDSSFIVALMSRIQSEPVDTFTVGLSGKWHDESAHAELVAKDCETRHHLLPVRADAAPVMSRVVWHLDEPMADAATIPTYLMSELTRTHVTVILSGEGADELLAGYDKYKLMHYGRLAAVPPVRALAAAGLHWPGLGISPRRGLSLLSPRNLADAYLNLTSVFDGEEKAKLLSPELRREASHEGTRDLVARLLDTPSPAADLLDRIAYLDIKTWLPNDVLLKNDKMTMAHSLEARVPFLDHEFAEFAASIPNRYKLKWLREKHILRCAMRGVVPEPIIRRRKHGFTVPVSDWMSGELRPIVDELLAPSRIRAMGFWNSDYIEQLRRRDHGVEFYRRQLWTIVTFEMWYRVFFENGGLDHCPADPTVA